MVWLSVFGIVNVRTDVDAFDCTGGCTNTERKSIQKVDSGRKSLAALGNRPRSPVLRLVFLSGVLPTDLFHPAALIVRL